MTPTAPNPIDLELCGDADDVAEQLADFMLRCALAGDFASWKLIADLCENGHQSGHDQAANRASAVRGTSYAPRPAECESAGAGGVGDG